MAPLYTKRSGRANTRHENVMPCCREAASGRSGTSSITGNRSAHDTRPELLTLEAEFVRRPIAGGEQAAAGQSVARGGVAHKIVGLGADRTMEGLTEAAIAGS